MLNKSQEKFDDEEMIGKYKVKDLKKIFCSYANSINGSIDETKLKKLFKEKFNIQIFPQQIKNLMKNIDDDSNGTLEINEFLKFMKKWEDIDEDVYKEVFKIFDRNETGYLTPESVHHIFLSLGEKIELNEISNILKENDADGDGNLNFQDFKIMMNNGLEEIRKKNPQSLLLNLNNKFNTNMSFLEDSDIFTKYFDYNCDINDINEFLNKSGASLDEEYSSKGFSYNIFKNLSNL